MTSECTSVVYTLVLSDIPTRQQADATCSLLSDVLPRLCTFKQTGMLLNLRDSRFQLTKHSRNKTTFDVFYVE